MKKEYQTPAIEVVRIVTGNLLEVLGASGNADLKMSQSGSDEDARSRGASNWDDEY